MGGTVVTSVWYISFNLLHHYHHTLLVLLLLLSVGQGFKMAPVVGKMLCEMAFGKQTSYDLEPFTLKSLLERVAKAKL